MSEVRCKRCGRKLTNPVSVSRGYGPTCFKIIFGASTNPDRMVFDTKDMRRLVEVFPVEENT